MQFEKACSWEVEHTLGGAQAPFQAFTNEEVSLKIQRWISDELLPLKLFYFILFCLNEKVTRNSLQ